MTYLFDDDFVSISQGYLLRQFSGKSRINGLLQGFGVHGQALQAVYKNLLDMRTLQNAVGAQLDGIGDILGLSRSIGQKFAVYFGFIDQPQGVTFGQGPIRDVNQSMSVSSELDDTTYRTLLALKVLLNTSHATIPEIEAALQKCFALTQCTITATGPAELTITMTESATTPPVLWINVLEYLPIAAGITVILTQKTS